MNVITMTLSSTCTKEQRTDCENFLLTQRTDQPAEYISTIVQLATDHQDKDIRMFAV